MSKRKQSTVSVGQQKWDQLEYALALIDAISIVDDEPQNILENSLKIMDFGEITVRQMLDYIEAVR